MKVLGFDPASGKGTKKATWPSYIVLGCNPTEEDPNIYLLDLFRRQMGIEDQIDVLLYGNKSKGLPGFYAQYAYDAAIVEENGYQNAILALERVQAAREKGVIIQGHYTTGEKQDPEWGVRGMEKMMMDGTFRIPARLPSDLAKASDLIDQLLLFPKGVYDYCMALWFAWRFIKRHTSSKYHSFYRPGFGGDLVPVPGRDPTTDQDAGRGQYRRPLYTPKLPRNRLLGL